jgi:hypothetical protein
MKDEDARKPLKERIEEKVRDLWDDLAEALENIIVPAPEPVPIPVRKRW